MISLLQKKRYGNYILFRESQGILLIIILIGLLLRLSTINVPLLDTNAWKQTEIAAIARNFYEGGFNILYPQVDWRGSSEGYVESEFQIYPFIVAILYNFLGVHDFLGRLVSLLFFVISTVLIFKLTLNIFDEKTAIWTVLFFTISPLNIHFSRAFMPTFMLVCCSIASIYYFSKWVDTGHWIHFIISSIATSLAILIKLPSLYLGLPLLYLAVKKQKNKVFFRWEMWLFATLILLSAIAWYYHARQLFYQTHLTFGIWGEGTSKFGGSAYWFNADFYRTITSRLFKDILPVGGILFAIIGFFLKQEKKNNVIYWWCIAFFVYIFIVAQGHQTHLYYQMPLVPILCIYAGRGVNHLWGKDFFKDSLLKSRLLSKIALTIVLIVFVVASVIRSQHYLSYNVERLAYGRRIEHLTEKESLIIFGGWNKGSHLQVENPSRDPIDFYFSNRKGWEINLDDWSLVLIDTLREQGAKYFASFWPMGLEKKKEFALEMKEKYKLLERTDRWIIYALEKKNL